MVYEVEQCRRQENDTSRPKKGTWILLETFPVAATCLVNWTASRGMRHNEAPFPSSGLEPSGRGHTGTAAQHCEQQCPSEPRRRRG